MMHLNYAPPSAYAHLRSRGFVLIFSLVVGAVLFTIAAAFTGLVATSIKVARYDRHAAEALALAEAGMDKAIYELNQSASYTGESNTVLGGGNFTIEVSGVDSNTKRIQVTGRVPSAASPLAERSITATASVDSSLVSFRYGVQVGNGGLEMNNGSVVQGNAYSNGNIYGSGIIKGDATAASLSTISGVTIEDDAWAHALSGCVVIDTITYNTTNTCTSTSSNGGQPDADPAPMPISDAQIAEWEALAEAGGTIAGNYTVTGDQTLGPKKITGNLTVDINAKIRLSGPVWVVGDVIFKNNSYFLVDASTGNQGATLIADDPSNRAAKGKIDLSNNMTIDGNGNPDSNPMALSMKIGSDAITLSNNADSVLLYAPYGTVVLSNNSTANMITADKIHLHNNVTLIYKTGLQNASFSNGPGGSWVVDKGTYVIIR